MRSLALALCLAAGAFGQNAIFFGSNVAAASGGIQFINSASGGATSGNLDQSVTGAANMTGADLEVMFCGGYNAGLNPSDSLSNSWNALSLYDDVGQLFYAVNPTVGSSQTFKCAQSDAQYSCTAALGFSGVATSSPLDSGTANGTSSGGTGTTIQPGTTGTPGVNGEVIIAGVRFDTSSTLSINGSFSSPVTVNYSAGAHFGCGLSYWIQTGATAVNPEFTFGASQGTTSAAIAGFKP